MCIEEFLSNPLFLYFIFPIISAVLGIYVKYVTRNDQYAKFEKEDLAVGLDLIRTACLMFVLLTTEKAILLLDINKKTNDILSLKSIDLEQVSSLQSQAQELTQKISSVGWKVALFFMLLWAISTIVRKWGWKSDTELKPLIGIAIPLSVGILSLVVVMLGVSK